MIQKFVPTPIILMFFLSVLNTQFRSQTKTPQMKYVTVEGYLTSSSQYCGGMPPSEEEERELHTPKAYYTKLYIRKGNKNSTKKPILDSTVTDSKGHFKFMLPPGEYVIIMPYQKDKKILSTLHKLKSKDIKVNNLCLKYWWKGGLFKVSVRDSSIKGLDYNFHNRCFVPYPFPCISYYGPYPS